MRTGGSAGPRARPTWRHGQRRRGLSGACSSSKQDNGGVRRGRHDAGNGERSAGSGAGGSGHGRSAGLRSRPDPTRGGDGHPWRRGRGRPRRWRRFPIYGEFRSLAAGLWIGSSSPDLELGSEASCGQRRGRAPMGLHGPRRRERQGGHVAAPGWRRAAAAALLAAQAAPSVRGGVDRRGFRGGRRMEVRGN